MQDSAKRVSQGWNRPFALLLSGLETGHPTAGSPSPACDFSVSDEQKAVFLLSVLDCSECDSSGLDHLNSSWSIAHLREYFRRKIGHSWTARKPSFLNDKRPYIVTSHSTHRVSPVSLWQVRSFELGFGFLKLKLEHRLSERVLEKKTRTKSIAVQESRASWTPSISQSSPGIHTACTPPVLFQDPSAICKKRLVALTSLALQPFPLAFCQLLKVSGVIIWPKLPKTTAGANITLSLNASTCFVTEYSHLGDMRAKRKHRWHCTCFREVSSLSRFQRTGGWKSPRHRLLGTSMTANIFLREDVLPMHTTVLLGTRKFFQSAWRMASKKALPGLTWPLKTIYEIRVKD